MIIEHLRVDRLHGLIDADLSFKEDLNIIVGRNGAGKTSILSILSNVVRLDLAGLRSVPFDKLELTLNTGREGHITIEATNSKDISQIRVNWVGRYDLTVPLADLDVITRNGLRRVSPAGSSVALGLPTGTKLLELYQHWSIFSNEFLRLARLTFVRLDRTIVALDPDGFEASETAPAILREKSRTAAQARDPIDEVIRVTQERYFDYRRQIAAIRAEAYQALMRLHFSPVKPLGRKANAIQLKRKLGELKSRIKGSSLTSDMQEVTESFFQSFEKLLQQTEEASQKKRMGRKSLAEESIQLMLELKERQTEQLLDIFDREQRLTQEAWAPIKKYLDALQHFLKESGKKLWFSEETLQLAFYIPTNGEEEKGPGRSLKDLSSGERQILIALTYLAFMSGSSSIFLIDEPELSLHLRWQSYLIGALRSLRPEGGQIIVATHAPEIAGRARANCIRLTQQYLPSVGGSDAG